LAVETVFLTQLYILRALADRQVHRQLAVDLAVAAVVVNYAASKAGADRVVDEIVSEGGRAIAVVLKL
jgi:hypothetical protein